MAGIEGRNVQQPDALANIEGALYRVITVKILTIAEGIETLKVPRPITR